MMIYSMKTSSLVNFYSTVAAFQKDYAHRNPGLVIASQVRFGNHYDKGHAYVLWNTGEITREHMSYLKAIENG